MSMKKKLTMIFTVLGFVALAIFVMLVYQKILKWFGGTVGDSNWAIIISGLLVLLFLTLGYVSKEKIKKKFFS